MKSYYCSKCGSSDIKQFNCDFGKCLNCGAKLILEDCEFEDIPEEDIIDEENEFEEDDEEVIDEENEFEEDDEDILDKEENEVIQCEKCGSTEVDVISEDLAICKHCKSKILLNVSKKVVNNIVNEVHITTTGGSRSFYTYAIKKDIKSELFFREAIIQNYAKQYVPVEFIDRDFGPVTLDYESYYWAICNVDVDYSASVGYDRTEHYREWDDVNKRYEDKTRTVTDWRPFSSTKHTQVEFVRQVGKKKEEEFFLEQLDYNPTIKNYDEADFEKGKIIMPSSGELDTIKNESIHKVGKSCIYDLPGDRNKNFTYSGSSGLKSVKVYSAPIYNISYNNDENKKFTIRGYAFGDVKPYGDVENEEGKIENEINQKLIKLFTATLILLISSLVVSVLFGLALMFSFSKILVFIFGIISLILATIYLIIYSNTKKKLHKSRSVKKYHKLKKFLSDKGFDELSEEEFSLFGISKEDIIDTKENINIQEQEVI